MWPQFLAYLMVLGVPAALRYHLKRHPEQQSEIFTAAFLLSTALSAVAMLLGIIFMPQFLQQYSTEVIRFAQWYMLMAPVVLLSETFAATLEAREEFTFANQARYLPPLITLALLIILVLTKQMSPFTTALAYAVPGLPIFFWMLKYLWHHLRPRWHGLKAAYRWLISYGLRAGGIDLLGTLSEKVDQVLVVGLLPPASMGLYTLALSVSRMLNLFHGSTITVLLPKIAARPVEEVVNQTGKAVRVSTAFTILAAIAVMLSVPFFMQLLYGSEYLAAVTVFRILTIEVVLSGTIWVLAQAFMALGRPGTLTLMQGLGLGLTVPFMLLLIPTYGLEGAGLALLCSTTIRLIFVLMCFPLILNVRPPSLIINREDWDFLQQILSLKKG
jgi:O-antigen/teichoic acid export membrane protein